MWHLSGWLNFVATFCSVSHFEYRWWGPLGKNMPSLFPSSRTSVMVESSTFPLEMTAHRKTSSNVWSGGREITSSSNTTGLWSLPVASKWAEVCICFPKWDSLNIFSRWSCSHQNKAFKISFKVSHSLERWFEEESNRYGSRNHFEIFYWVTTIAAASSSSSSSSSSTSSPPVEKQVVQKKRKGIVIVVMFWKVSKLIFLTDTSVSEVGVDKKRARKDTQAEVMRTPPPKVCFLAHFFCYLIKSILGLSAPSPPERSTPDWTSLSCWLGFNF